VLGGAPRLAPISMGLIFKWPGAKKREKLWREGARAEGVVLRLWWHSKLEGTYGIEFRVKFPDGSTADVKERFLTTTNQGVLAEGDVVRVRYDPSDYSKVRLDVPALEAPLHAAGAAKDARRDAALERLGMSDETTRVPTRDPTGS
jgi:hypothetical protein